MTRSTSNSRTIVGRRVSGPSTGRFLEVAAQALRFRVHESDHADPVLGMLTQLACDQLPDVTCADDYRVLNVRVPGLGYPARDPAAEAHEDDRERPERHELRNVRSDDAGDPGADEEQPGAHRDEVKDAGQLVHGGVARALLVEVVELVELRCNCPRRERQEEQEQLRLLVDRAPRQAEEQLGDEECDGETHEIRSEKCPPYEPSPPFARPGSAMSLDQLEGLGLERYRRVFPQRVRRHR